MRPRRLILAAIALNALTYSATAETAVGAGGRACPIAVPKVIRLTPESRRLGDHVVIYYAARERGWASRRILARFDVAGGAPEAPRGGCPRRAH